MASGHYIKPPNRRVTFVYPFNEAVSKEVFEKRGQPARVGLSPNWAGGAKTIKLYVTDWYEKPPPFFLRATYIAKCDSVWQFAVLIRMCSLAKSRIRCFPADVVRESDNIIEHFAIVIADVPLRNYGGFDKFLNTSIQRKGSFCECDNSSRRREVE